MPKKLMKKPKIMVVLGTRPEVIKLAPVVHWLSARRSQVLVQVCVTAQHREMLDQMMKTFGLPTHVDLDVMRADQSPMRVIREVLAGLEPLLLRQKPDMVIVQGDTTTALAGALAAFHMKVPVAHVEAGLRSFNRQNPFPEEANRVLVDHLSELLFAPTSAAKANLLRENIPSARILVTGNTVVDALHWSLHQAGGSSAHPAPVPYLLVTIHRRESFGQPIQNIFRALRSLVESRKDLHICYPLHPNPNVRRCALRMLRHPRIQLRGPVPYLDFVRLMRGARLILSDSGGIVEEAASLNKPVIILRQVTERPELVGRGGAVLAGTETKTIVRETQRILSNESLWRKMSRVKNPYGDGRAADRIGSSILRYLGCRASKPEEFA